MQSISGSYTLINFKFHDFTKNFQDLYTHSKQNLFDEYYMYLLRNVYRFKTLDANKQMDVKVDIYFLG